MALYVAGWHFKAKGGVEIGDILINEGAADQRSVTAPIHSMRSNEGSGPQGLFA
jgi:hypothetical protein